jgi:hypothetical protein
VRLVVSRVDAAVGTLAGRAAPNAGLFAVAAPLPPELAAAAGRPALAAGWVGTAEVRTGSEPLLYSLLPGLRGKTGGVAEGAGEGAGGR